MSPSGRWLAPETLRRLQQAALIAFAAALPLGKSPAEISLVAGLLLWGLRTALGHRRPIIPTNPLNLLLVVWLAAAVCSMQNSVDLVASVHGLRKLLKAVGLYLLVIDTVDAVPVLRRVLAGCLVGLGLVSVDGLWQAVAGRDLLFGRAAHEMLGGVRRVVATFHHPAGLAIHLASFCPLAVALAFRGAPRQRAALGGLAALSVAALILTWNRGGTLGLLGGLAVMTYWMRHWGPAAVAGAMLVIQGLFVPAAVRAWSATMPSWIHRLTEPDRLAFWQTTVEMIKAHPLAGVGVNSFVQAYPAYGSMEGAVLGPYAHNQYLHLWAEIGLVGLAAFLVMVARLLRAVGHGLASRPAAPEVAAVSAGLGGCLIGYLVVGGFESALYYSRSGVTLWLLAGLLMAVEAIGSRPAALGRSARAPAG